MKTLKLTFMSFAVAMFAASCGGSESADTTVKEEVKEIVEEVTESKTELSVDTEASVVNWKGSKIIKSHNGTLKLSKGSVELENGSLVGGNFVIDMTTMDNEDLKGTDGYAKLLGHLKSPDFFNVDSFPTASFVITSVAPAAEGTEATNTVTGDLTIKGITNSISFPATVNAKDGAFKATAPITFDRSNYDVRFGSKTFFPDKVADELIKNEIELNVVLVAGGNAAM